MPLPCLTALNQEWVARWEVAVDRPDILNIVRQMACLGRDHSLEHLLEDGIGEHPLAKGLELGA